MAQLLESIAYEPLRVQFDELQSELLNCSALYHHQQPQHDDKAIQRCINYLNTIVTNDRVRDIVMECEIIVRSFVQENLTINPKGKSGENDQFLFQIVSFLLRVVSNEEINKIAIGLIRLPFLMIEEIFSAVTISHAERLWERLEECISDMMLSHVFSKGNLVILRTCNSLLRRLSKTCNTEFCGRILMFLAIIYPLSEKSALNINSVVNSSNTTIFDNGEEFLETVRAHQQLLQEAEALKVVAAMDTDTDGNEGGTSQYSLPTNLKDFDPTIKYNSFLTDKMKGKGDKNDKNGGKDGMDHCSYEEYKQFWQLQSVLSTDIKTSFDTADKWQSFLTTANVVFNLFKALPASINSGEDNSTTYFGCKYLTSSKLLVLQLRDPLIRQQLACQILFLMHWLRFRYPSYIDSILNPVKPAATVVSIRGRSTPAVAMKPLATQATPSKATAAANTATSASKGVSSSTTASSTTSTATTAAVAATAAVGGEAINPALGKFLEEIKAIEAKAYELIKSSIPSNQSNLPEILQRLLYSETRYIKWKKAGCLDYQRKPTAASAELSSASWKDISNPFVPRYSSSQCEKFITKLAEVRTLRGSYYFDVRLSNVKEYLQYMGDEVPSFDRFVQDYVDAEDPDMGIEEDYHPKNNPLYCWQLSRKLAQKNICLFKNSQDADISNILRILNILPEKAEEEPIEEGGESESLNADTEVVSTAAVDAEEMETDENHTNAATAAAALYDDITATEIEEQEESQGDGAEGRLLSGDDLENAVPSKRMKL